MDIMSSKQILKNYQDLKAYLLELQDELSITNTIFFHELVEHSLTSEFVISIIKLNEINFEEIKTELIHELLNSKDWFYSLNYNFKELSIDSLYDDYGIELEENSEDDFDDKDEKSEHIHLNSFKDSLNKSDSSYLENIIDNNSDLISSNFEELIDVDKNEINERFGIIKRLFPDGLKSIQENSKETENPIILFKLKYIGIINEFPPLYFAQDAEKKIISIIKYVQEEFLNQSIEEFTKSNSIALLYDLKLISIARYLNYSWNKLIHLVYPKHYNPWQLGKVDHGYWDNQKNRISAVKWIIQEYLNTNPENIWRLIKAKSYNRALYGKLGLSYLYNEHYNSLFKSLHEAYPELPYWQLGIFPENYWQNDAHKIKAKDAFKWMLIQERIDFEKIPEALRNKSLNRKTFNKYGLSTMFDYCFRRNFYDLVEFTFSNKFKPWEIGNVKKTFWSDADNQHEAIHWFLNEQDTNKKEIFKKIESKNFSKELFKKSKLANFFKTVFNNNPENVFKFFLKPKRQLLNENKRLLKRYQKESKHKIERSIVNYILYGFNLPLMSYFEDQKQDRLKRKSRRMKRIVEEER